MLTEERFAAILKLVNKNGSITNQELVKLLGISESTVRRDVSALAADNKLIRVHGGAMALKKNLNSTDFEVKKRRSIHTEQKTAIAEYSAQLIDDNELIYIDAGTSTELLVKSIPDNKKAIFVTNAVAHAAALEKKGCEAYIIGGRLKPVTEAIIGSTAMLMLKTYNFSKGFFGTNGIEHEAGLTTPDAAEANIKRFAMSRCREKYVLCDSSKFDCISSVSFAEISEVTIITEEIPEEYKNYSVIKV